MNIVTTKIEKSDCFYELSFGNSTVVMLKTELDKKPLSFRIIKDTNVEAFQLTNIMQFVNVQRSDELEAKTIRVVLDANCEVVGYGSPTEDIFILFQDEDFKTYTEDELRRMDVQNNRLLKREII
ncbi:MAG: hypothetical protein HFJ42_05765 [Clostridia bacterium]|nr:hypothetical protein [Clostridia bacterium]